MPSVNAGGRLDRLPISGFHYRILGVVGSGMFLDAFEIYLQAGVLAALIASGWSTPGQNANSPVGDVRRNGDRRLAGRRRWGSLRPEVLLPDQSPRLRPHIARRRRGRRQASRGASFAAAPEAIWSARAASKSAKARQKTTASSVSR